MIDIRQVCRVFLEFVYDRSLLPEGIIETLKQKKEDDTLEWDFYEVLNILSRKDKYPPPSKDKDKLYSVKYAIYNQCHLFNSFDVQKTEWLNRHDIKSGDKSFKAAMDYRNIFFHNVAIEWWEKFFCSLLEEFIMDAPVDGTVKKDYIRRIEDFRNNTPEYLEDKLKEKNKELEKLKEKNAQLQISLLQANQGTLPIKDKYDSLPKNDELRDFWYDHLGLKLGRDNSKYANYGTAKKTHPETYWASPNLEKLETDWYYILRREEKNTLKLLFIPTNAFSRNQVGIDDATKPRTEEQKKTEFDVFIRDDNYQEEYSGLSFEKYVCAIADFNKREIYFPKHTD